MIMKNKSKQMNKKFETKENPEIFILPHKIAVILHVFTEN